jgi:hypothetical protein
MVAPEETFVTHELCEQTTSQILESQQRLHAKLDSMEKRLFRDNGSVSIQTRLDRHEQILRALLWIVGVIGGGVLAACGSGVVILVREMIARSAS